MCVEQSESIVKNALKSICCDYGWSYGVIWSFDQRDSLLLTIQDAYFDGKLGAVIDDMYLQVQMLGGGIIGQAAFTKKHQWMFSDTHYVEKNSAGSVSRCDFFQDDSDFQYQFASGVKTIAVIPVEPQGVLQFGSTQQIAENADFVNQTKRVFRGMGSCFRNSGSEYMPTHLNYENCGFSGLFASSIPSGTTNLKETKLNEFDCFREDPLGRNMQNFSDHWQNSGTESQVQQTLCSNAWSGGESTLTSFQHQASELRSQPSHNVLHVKPETVDTCGSTAQNFQNSTFTFQNNSQCSSGSLITQKPSTLSLNEIETELLGQSNLPSTNELFESANCIADHVKGCSLDSLYQWFDSSLDQSNKTDFTTMNNDFLSEALKFISQPHELSGGDVQMPLPVSHPATSSITNLSTSSGKEKCPNIFKVENDLFDNFGVDLGYAQAGNINDILMPVKNSGKMDLKYTSDCISQQHIGSTFVQRNGLFSKLGIEQLIESTSSGTSSSVTRPNFEDQLSSTAQRKNTGSSLGSNKVQLAGSLFQQKEDITKQSTCSWPSDSYRTLIGRSALEAKKHPFTAKTVKKKGKPGARPRPKDRQLIQDRLVELRELIPNGDKMSIDSLLDRTIKHMLFLQSVTKHADTVKLSDKTKDNMRFKKDTNSSRGGGVTWACEYGDQSMVCPLLVEDLSSPGQMLIEMQFEEQGFFLEIVDIIRGFGLTILKGAMEIKKNKIWARFNVESEVNRRVSRHEIFSTLIQLLQMISPNSVDASKQLGNTIDGGTKLFNNFSQCVAPGQLR